jgi:hypothetical protein
MAGRLPSSGVFSGVPVHHFTLHNVVVVSIVVHTFFLLRFVCA